MANVYEFRVHVYENKGYAHPYVAMMIITFRVSRRRRKMYIGHARLCVRLSVRRRIHTLLHRLGCNSKGMVEGALQSCIIGGFAVDAHDNVAPNAKRHRVLVFAVCLVVIIIIIIIIYLF